MYFYTIFNMYISNFTLTSSFLSLSIFLTGTVLFIDIYDDHVIYAFQEYIYFTYFPSVHF